MRYRDRGVGGFDIAGAEAGFPPSRHLSAFEYLRRENAHFTIHAGEAFGLPSIWEAIQWCGADRLGHGVRIIDDIRSEGDSHTLGRLAAYVRDCRIPLEMCPTSNLQTGAAESISEHPITLLKDLRFRVTINTDNRLMSGTSMSREMQAPRRRRRVDPRRPALGDDQRDEVGVHPVRRAARDHRTGRQAGVCRVVGCDLTPCVCGFGGSSRRIRRRKNAVRYAVRPSTGCPIALRRPQVARTRVPGKGWLIERGWMPIRRPRPDLADDLEVTAGVLPSAALRRSGVTRGLKRAMVDGGRWRAVPGKGIVVPGGRADEARWREALMRVGPQARLGGVTALEVDGLRGFAEPWIHIWVPKGFEKQRVPEVRLHETRRWTEADAAGSGVPRSNRAVSTVQAALWSVTLRQAALCLVMPIQQRIVPAEQVAVEPRPHRPTPLPHTVAGRVA